MICSMVKDTRKISGIYYDNGEQGWGIHQNSQITKIEVYEEPGNGAMEPWFAVYKNAELYVRVAARNMQVFYFPGGAL